MSSDTPQKELKPIVPDYGKNITVKRLFTKYLKDEAISVFNDDLPNKIYKYIYNCYHLLFNDDDIDDKGDKQYCYLPGSSHYALSVQDLLEKAINSISVFYYKRAEDMNDKEKKEFKLACRRLLGHFYYTLNQLSDEQKARSWVENNNNDEAEAEAESDEDDEEEEEKKPASSSLKKTKSTSTPTKEVKIDEGDKVTMSKEEFTILQTQLKAAQQQTPTKPCNCKSTNCSSVRCGCRTNGFGCNVNCACASSHCQSPFKPYHNKGSHSNEMYNKFAAERLEEMTMKMKSLQH